jgi:TRAP-type transport system small permease protein
MKAINLISRVMIYVEMGLVLVLMFLTVADVILRGAFNKPINGTVEIATLVMACLTLGLAWCGLKGQHISVNMIMNRFSPRVRAIVDAITFTVGLFIAGIITWRAFVETTWEYKFHYTASYTLALPTFPFWLIYCLGWAMLCLVIVILIAQKVNIAIRGDQVKEEKPEKQREVM